VSRWITWNDKYCPKGHIWQFVGASGLFSDYYYCPKCDEMWEPTVRKLSLKNITKNYNESRPLEMKKRAQFLMWQESLTPNDFAALHKQSSKEIE